MEYRIETDTMGEVQVPAERYWGAQTQRSLTNFRIGDIRMPREVIHAFALLKKAAAAVNVDLAGLEEEKARLIAAVCDEILAGELDDEFPLVVFQAASATQRNIAGNEATRKRASALAGRELGSREPVHPTDDVSRSQSSNDTFPTAMHIAAVLAITRQLLPRVQKLRDAADAQAREFRDIVKIGRTHLMDATPLTLGQEFSGYVAQLDKGMEAVRATLDRKS